jgi:exopolysaccharide production protein ExoY
MMEGPLEVAINQNIQNFVDTVLNQKSCSQVSTTQVVANSEVSPMQLWKRGFDIALVVVCTPILVVVGALMALVIRFGSSGPVIFRQERVGYKGMLFTCYKFRTMHIGAEVNSHCGHTAQLIKSEAPMTKLDAGNDPRVIPFGKIIRATGLDELPQLINVLKGEMSLVGPRPCIPYEYEIYESWQKRRFDAVPGLTGLWQVSGKNRTTFNQMINMDIEYSERASLWLDIKIISKTIPALMVQCYDQRARSRKSSVIQAGVRVSKPVSPVNV